MILFRTLLNRDIWMNPLHNVIGIWGLYNNEGKITTEVLENIVLFIPFSFLLLWTYGDKILGSVKTGLQDNYYEYKDNNIKLTRVLYQTIKVVFLFSFTIEMLQLLLRLGTWQLSDLFFNTLGGVIGGALYWILCMLKRKSMSDKT